MRQHIRNIRRIVGLSSSTPASKRLVDLPTASALPIAICVLGALTLSLAAQETPDLAIIRKTPFASLDRGNVQRWVEQQMEQLLACDTDQDAIQLGRTFRQQVVEHFDATDATKEFKDGLAKIVIQAFRQKYKPMVTQKKFPRPLGTAYALLTMNHLATPISAPALTLVLKSPVAGSRLVAITGLLRIHEKIVDQQQWATVESALREAGIVEDNPVVLSNLFRLLTTQQDTRAETAQPVIQTILDARLDKFEKENVLPTEADAKAAAWVGQRAAESDSVEATNKATLQIARLLADAVHVCLSRNLFLSDKLTKIQTMEKEQMERVVRTAEKQLEAIAKSKAPGVPQPDVTAAMFVPQPDQAGRVAQELDKWMGTGEEPGLLNAPPFSFSPGLGIKRAPPPSTAPSPSDT